MKKSFLAFFFLLIILLACSKAKAPPHAALIVDGDTISLAEADSALVQYLNKSSVRDPFWKNPDARSLITYRKASLRGLVQRFSVEREAKRRGIVIDSPQVKTYFDTLLARRFSGDREKFFRVLDQKKITQKDFLEDVRNQMLFDALIDSLVKPIATPEESLKAYFQRNPDEFRKIKRKVSHICLYKKLTLLNRKQKQLMLVESILKKKDSTLSGEALEKAKAEIVRNKKALAQRLYNRLRKGEKFEILAREYSEDTASYYKDGALGKVQLRFRGPIFSNAAFGLKTGRYSSVVEDEWGFFIIRADADIETTYTSFDETKRSLRKRFDEDKRKMIFTKFLSERKVTILIDTSKAAFYLIKP